NAMQQTHADQRTHSTWIPAAPEEAQCVVNLNPLRNADALPRGPDPLKHGLCGRAGRRMNAATDSCRVNDVQTVETGRATEKARPDEVRLMCLVGKLGRKDWIECAFWFVTIRSLLQAVSDNDSVD